MNAKDLMQRQAVQALKNNQSGIIAIATGGGKSKIAIDYLKQESTNNSKIALVVPTERLRDSNWKDEFTKWNADYIYKKIDRYCYASINKVKGKHYDIVILDELQNITPNNFEFFMQNTVSKIIGLTATMPKEKDKLLLLHKLGLRPIFELSLDDAVKDKIVAPYDITLIELSLNNKDKTVLAGNKNKRWYTTEQKQYEYLSELVEKAKLTGSNHQVKMKALQRMRFIYNLETKKKAAKFLLNNMISNDEKFLIFTGSIQMAEELEPCTFHSKTDDKCLNKFEKGQHMRLSAVKALNEGVNISNLDGALIVQATSKERHLIQKIGRVVRYRPDHKATIYLLYVKNTVDEVWMRNATKEIDNSSINTLKLSINGI
jgi:superfamily II DNA or RNA helicase